MDVIEAARSHGIMLRSAKFGSFKMRCPQCSDTRKNKDDRCLSIRVDETGLGWRCFNCNWSGGELDNAGSAAHKMVGKARIGSGNGGTYGALLRQARPVWGMRS